MSSPNPLTIDHFGAVCGCDCEWCRVKRVPRFVQPLLPASSTERKNTPVYSGVMAYFPRALAYVAQVSKAGNDKHNPGEPLHWSKDKSNDHADCVARHLIEHGTVDAEDKLRHSGKLAWRALALLEIELENEANKTTA